MPTPHRQPHQVSPILALAGLAFTLVTACSDDPKPPSVVPSPSNNTPDMSRPGDMSGPGPDQSGADMRPGPDQGPDMRSEDMGQPTGQGLCTNLTKLGTIMVTDRTDTIQGSTLAPAGQPELPNGTGTQCGGQLAPERVFEFQVDKPARLTATLRPKDNTAWVLETRRGACTDAQTLFCSANVNAYTIALEPGRTYYLVAEPQRQDAAGEFELDLKLTPLVCLPVGGTTCAGADVALCEAGGERQTTYTCGAPCSMNHCGADLCANAVTVSAGTFRLSGQAKAYKNSLNFKDATRCVNPDTLILPEFEEPIPQPGSPGNIDTPGQDVVFRLPGLRRGQKLTVDASNDVGDQADSAIFVLNSCDVMDCRVGLDIGDKLTQWSVPEDGDYFVVVDRVRSSDADIAVQITIE